MIKIESRNHISQNNLYDSLMKYLHDGTFLFQNTKIFKLFYLLILFMSSPLVHALFLESLKRKQRVVSCKTLIKVMLEPTHIKQISLFQYEIWKSQIFHKSFETQQSKKFWSFIPFLWHHNILYSLVSWRKKTAWNQLGPIVPGGKRSQWIGLSGGSGF